MTTDDSDEVLLRLYRASANERPDAALDGRVLEAAHMLRVRRRQIPLIFAAAACLLVALFANLPGHQHVPAAPMPDSRTFGLYEGRAALVLSDPQATQQSIFRQMSGGNTTAGQFR